MRAIWTLFASAGCLLACGVSDEVHLDPADDTEQTDLDGDGHDALADGGDDCDDDDPDVFPGADEQCDDVDHDCDGVDHDDEDGDGYTICEDCDDGDPSAFPDAEEVCDGVDNDCDGAMSGAEYDGDGDGFRGCEGDCDDEDLDTHPLGTEIPYDGIDQDCDGDDLDDVDGDGYRWDGVEDGDDCDDDDPDVHPDAVEIAYDGFDTNCDGLDDPPLGEFCLSDTTTIAVGGFHLADITAADADDGPSGAGFYYDDIEFEASAGQQLQITMTDWYDPDLDPYLFLLGPTCALITQDDNSGSDDDATIVVTIPTGGVYTVVATTANAAETGWYSLQIDLL